VDYKDFSALVKAVPFGKQLPDAVYIHESALHTVPDKLFHLVSKVATALKIQKSEWNLLKLYKRDFKISLLFYPNFDTESYPALHTSFTIDLQRFSMRKAEYSKTDNPPILHRKETFVTSDYPKVELFKIITKEAEDIGLFENVRTIGFKKNWERLIESKGYYLDEVGRLLPRPQKMQTSTKETKFSEKIQRHLTAIDRNKLSNPMQIVARHNYLNGEMSVLDYGCGKGDDVRELEAHGIDVSGWDPVHNPEGLLIESDIVNLGFVLNVIEDKEERDEVLRRAWTYTNKFLIVSVMIAGEAHIRQFQPYRDGVVTSRNTFQKYYTQSEFRDYLELVLKENAIAVGQGVFIAFKDKIEEQKFLLERQYVKRDWLQQTQRMPKVKARQSAEHKLDVHSDLLNDFWARILDLGRIPVNDEYEHSFQLKKIFGSHKKAFETLTSIYGISTFEAAKKARTNDLLVYFALGLFDKRKTYRHIPESLKRDIKALFISNKLAIETATEILFSVGSSTLIEEKAKDSYVEMKTGEFVDGHSWTLHKDLISKLPPELRIYIGCATQLYGDLSAIQLVKIHFTSGKVSLMSYRDWDKETPYLIERIKIKLREQDVDFFDYVDRYEPPPLTNKHLFVLPESYAGDSEKTNIP